MNKLSHLKRKCLTAFAAASACIAAPAAASEVYTLGEGSDEVAVYSITQQEGAAYARAYNEITTHEIGSKDYYKDRKKYIAEKIAADMTAKGYNAQYTQIFSQDLASFFSFYAKKGTEEVKFDEYAHTPINGIGPLSLRYPNNDDFCAVVAADDNFTINDWFKAMIDEGDIGDMPPIYGKMAAEFVNYHESAHCLKMNEPEADYLATLQIMNKYYADDPANTERFLWMISSIRNHNAMQSKESYSKYFMTGTYIHMAMDKYKANPSAFDTEKKIFEHRLTGLPTSMDFVNNIDKTFQRSLDYLEVLLKKPMCKVSADQVKVSYSSPSCR